MKMMNMMKIGLFKMLVVLGMLTVLGGIDPARALAFTVSANNQYPHKMWIAAVEWNDSAGNWRCHGWWGVDPYSSREINFNDSTERKYVYLYAYTSEASFSGEGYPKSISRIVNGDKFEYYDGQVCPDGKNRRKVYFAQYEIVEGHVDYSP